MVSCQKAGCFINRVKRPQEKLQVDVGEYSLVISLHAALLHSFQAVGLTGPLI